MFVGQHPHRDLKYDGLLPCDKALVEILVLCSWSESCMEATARCLTAIAGNKIREMW